MTDEERENERIRALASAVYHQLVDAQRAEDYVRKICSRHGEKPAFKQYMAEMLLTERLREFLARPKQTRG